MLEHTSHIADSKNPLYTLCGESWQGWQAPEKLTYKDPLAVTLPPHQEPRPHKDVVRQCQACRKKLVNG